MAYEALFTMARRIGTRNMLTFSENVEKEMVSMAGWRLKVTDGTGSRARLLWLSRRINLTRTKAMQESLPPDVRWPHPMHILPIARPTLRSVYPSLVLDYVGGANMSSSEISMLNKMLLIDESKQITRYAGVTEWMHWLGYPNHVIQLIKRHFPCDSSVLTDAPKCGVPTTNGVRGQPFCPTCHKTLGILGASWHIMSLSPPMMELLITPLDVRDEDIWDFSLPPHQCSFNCPKARNKLL